MMDLFDPKFIRTKGDDSLIGKPVFFGDSLDIIRSCVEQNMGRQIQKRWGGSSPWEDVSDPMWLANFEYRVAPEYRPYKDFDEFLDDVQERFPTTRNRPAGTMPLVWVKLQQNHWICRLITGYGIDNGGTLFELQDKGYTCNAMFETFTYMDETPFGKKEQL